MKSKVSLLFTLIILMIINSNVFCFSTDLHKQILKGKELLYNAYLKYDEAAYMLTYSFFERILSAEPDNELALYYVTCTQYRLLGLAMNKQNDDLFDKFYDSALENCEKLSDSEKLKEEAKVLVAAIYMMKLAGSPLQGPFLAPKINSLLDEVIASDFTNPRALLIKGIMDYNTPAFFGGSVENAIVRFNKAVEVFENKKIDKENINPDWGYIETLAWLGQAYAKAENIDKAKKTYEKALAVEPNFGWVRGLLLPSLSKKED